MTPSRCVGSAATSGTCSGPVIWWCSTVRSGPARPRSCRASRSRCSVRGPVTSPTFVIARRHPGPRVTLLHVDAYRLGTGLEIDDLDLDSDVADCVTVVEWGAGKVESLGESRLDITIDRTAAAGPDDPRRGPGRPARRPSIDPAAGVRRSWCVLRGLAGRVSGCPRSRFGPVLVLALDTATEAVVAAVLRRSDGRERNGGPGQRTEVLGRGSGRGPMAHGEQVAVVVEQALTAAGVTVARARRRRGRPGPRTLHRTARGPGVRRDAGLVAGHPRARRVHARRAGRRGAGRNRRRSCSSRRMPGAARSTGRGTQPTVAGSKAQRSAPPSTCRTASCLRSEQARCATRRPFRVRAIQWIRTPRSWLGSWPTPSRGATSRTSPRCTFGAPMPCLQRCASR